MLAIIWHSRTGAAQAMAQAAAQGAAQAGAPAQLLPAEQINPAQCIAAQGFLFVCPENLGSMSGEMKAFFDRCYYPLLEQIAGRAYATAIAAGTAGQGAQAQIDRIVTGWRLRRVAPPCIILTGADRPDSILAPKALPHTALQKCRELGQLLASGLEMGAF
ncbi:NAD(P)H-dependent oxidoreductase [Novosphingobium sp. AAP1]|uniref:NAD(P)H-dependent oxidoreductase n=1 Tax=Novosphingobium sp. AAP1 TaxID=1523413 RepID=UPI000ADB79E8|nr:NAD(P)H-dependent oxidoreductase [Novosphingobium sp. AAP1]